MTTFQRLRLTLALSVASCFPAAAVAQLEILQEIASAFEVSNGSIDYDPDNEKVSWVSQDDDPVVLLYDEVQIFADSIDYEYARELVRAKGDVSIYKDGVLYRGENIEYDTRTAEIKANALRSSLAPIYFDTDEFETETKEISVIDMGETMFTTHDSINPNFHIKARTVDIYPEDRIVFRNLTAYAGKVPVFYFPYLSQPFDDELGYSFAPGYSSNWGAYILNQYGTLVGDHTVAKYHLDFRSTRGVAGGIDLISRRHKENPNLGKFQFYYANDLAPDTTSVGTGSPRLGASPDADRYRINLQHRIFLPGPEESTFYLDIDFNKLSDEFFYEDFFPAEFRLDPNPDNIINLVKTDPRGELSLLARFETNDFFQTDTRLPELSLDITRQPVFNGSLFYESNSSIGILSERLASADEESSRDSIDTLEGDLELNSAEDPDFVSANPDFDEDDVLDQLAELRARVEERSFTRFHTYHELLYPKTIGGWLNVTPRIGLGFQSYSDVDGAGDPGSDSRPLIHAGLDASFKFSKVYPNVQSTRFGIDGIRHVVRPYANYSFLSADELEDGFPKIDRFVPTTRLRSLDIPRFTTIDDLQDWNILRLGVRNNLFTRRNERNYDWMGLNTFFDVFGEDPEFDRSHSNLFNEFYWRPLPWLRYDLDSQVPIGSGDFEFTEINNRLSFQPTKNWQFGLGHQLLQDHPFFEDSSLVTLNTYSRLNENWGFGMIQRYEIDDSTLEVQQYSLHRDLTSWTASLGALFRDNRGDQEFGIIFSLTLKAFPQVTIPLQLDPGSNSN